MADFNPYAAPESSRPIDRPLSDPDEGRGVWQDGQILVMAKIARLPMRCVKCNEPATNRLRRTLYWHNPALYLVILASPLAYIIVVMIVRKKVKIEVPLCDEHRAKRRQAILLSWILGLAGLGLCFTPTLGESYLPLLFVGLFLVIFSLIFGQYRSQVVSPLKIDDSHAWLKRVGPFYLADLPQLPSPYENANDPRIRYDVDL